ncbi:unnamed protein product [Victoria cruziana]
MKLQPGLSAIVTGGASGIGEALSFALGRKGVFVTIIDFSEEKGKEVVSMFEKNFKELYPNMKSPSSMFIKCDVSNHSELVAAFRTHLDVFGGLDICINSAGIATPVLFYKDKTDGTCSWRRTVHVNLMAVIDCTHLAIQSMETRGRPGVVLNIGSAAGIYPSPHDPIYAATKGGVVMFSRSLVPYKRQGIRVNVLCPEFVRTELGEKADKKAIELTGGFLSMQMVIDGAFELIEDETKAGACLWITNRRGMEYWPGETEKRKYLINPQKPKPLTHQSQYNVEIPNSFLKVIVQNIDHNFRKATEVVRAQLKYPIKSDHVVVKILYAGVNASDVNFTSGRYFGGKEASSTRLPFDAGFEAVGLVAAIGDMVNDIRIGTPVAVMSFGSYAEFTTVPAKHVFPMPKPDPEIVAMLTSGLTASIALEEAGHMQSGQVVLVTAAAGGTGQFAVQLAKLARNKVVATCGGKSKAAFLKELGVDRVIDYKFEDVKAVLKKEFPKGVDIVYESVGGHMFDICLNALAIYGRMVVIGMISQYQGEHGWKPLSYTGLCEKILAKSQTVAGFFLVQYGHLYRSHLEKLYNLFSSGKLKVLVDPNQFFGPSSVADAVEYLHSGESLGKVVVCMDPSFDKQRAKL